MKAPLENTKEPQQETIQRVEQESSSGGEATITDNRPAIAIQRKLRSAMGCVDDGDNPIQRKTNNTGLPDNLKSGIENLSGYRMDDVKVHYNSSKPAQLQAHAYAQGTDIHLAPGQEKHLPHEAWHVVQQKQGRVQPTRQLKSKVNINDDTGLEKEADVMGNKALYQRVKVKSDKKQNNSISNVAQRRDKYTIEEVTEDIKKETYILRLNFAGSGYDFITREESETEHTAVRELKVAATQKTGLTTNDDEEIEEFDITGPGGPSANKNLSLGGTFDQGKNSIKNLRRDMTSFALEKIETNKDKFEHVEVQIWGHSRGAVAAGYVAEDIQKENIENVHISVSLFDPVPYGLFGKTKNNDLNNVEATVVYSMGSGASIWNLTPGLMIPKAGDELIVETIVIVASQHSANLGGLFIWNKEEIQPRNISKLPPGVYMEDEYEYSNTEETLKKKKKRDYGIITLKQIGHPREFDGEWDRLKKRRDYKDTEKGEVKRRKNLFGMDTRIIDPSRKKLIKKAVDSLFARRQNGEDI